MNRATTNTATAADQLSSTAAPGSAAGGSAAGGPADRGPAEGGPADRGPAVHLLYFARVAELTGRREESWPAPAEPITGAAFLEQLQQRYPLLAPASRLRLAVNQTHAKHTALIRAGDEVAVFEPVTGG